MNFSGIFYLAEVKFFDHEAQLIIESKILLDVYQSVELPILSLGLLGNLISLTTLYRSNCMRTHSFFYHKVLTIFEILYGLNCVFQRLTNQLWEVSLAYQAYSNQQSALYSSSVSRYISTLSGYVILYMTLLIAMDRMLAFKVSGGVRLQSKRSAALLIVISLTFAAVFNSWSTVVENVVHEIRMSGNGTEMLLYQIVSRSKPEWFLMLKRVKNVYNSAIRMIYPLMLAGISARVIWCFIEQERHIAVAASPSRLRHDRNLFLLLLLTVISSFIHVIPTETKRILEFLYPMASLQKDAANFNNILSERIRTLNILYYGHIWLKLIGNLCTFLNRSINFYLYFLFNSTFRREVIRVFRHLIRGKSGRSARNGSRFRVTGGL